LLEDEEEEEEEDKDKFKTFNRGAEKLDKASRVGSDLVSSCLSGVTKAVEDDAGFEKELLRSLESELCWFSMFSEGGSATTDICC
jgi:hypothetical protein